MIADVVKSGEQALGLAYDFNTDHLFVRIAPAQVIRLIERPSGKILREMKLPLALQATAPRIWQSAPATGTFSPSTPTAGTSWSSPCLAQRSAVSS